MQASSWKVHGQELLKIFIENGCVLGMSLIDINFINWINIFFINDFEVIANLHILLEYTFFYRGFENGMDLEHHVCNECLLKGAVVVLAPRIEINKVSIFICNIKSFLDEYVRWKQGVLWSWLWLVDFELHQIFRAIVQNFVHLIDFNVSLPIILWFFDRCLFLLEIFWLIADFRVICRYPDISLVIKTIFDVHFVEESIVKANNEHTLRDRLKAELVPCKACEILLCKIGHLSSAWIFLNYFIVDPRTSNWLKTFESAFFISLSLNTIKHLNLWEHVGVNSWVNFHG